MNILFRPVTPTNHFPRAVTANAGLMERQLNEENRGESRDCFRAIGDLQ